MDESGEPGGRLPIQPGEVLHVQAEPQDLRSHSPPRIRLHDLRHTAATLLIEEGVGLKAVLRPRHPAMQDSVAEAMDRLFGAEHQIPSIPPTAQAE
jgi:integrase